MNDTSPQNRRFLNEEAKETIKTAPEGSVVLLTAPTGSGKTHFTLNDLKRWAKLHHGKILLVVNRSALKSQIIQTAMRDAGLDPHDIDLEQNGCVVLESITIVTYQYLIVRAKPLGHIAGKIGPCKPDEFEYVVFDECHFFLGDAFLTAKDSWKLFQTISYSSLGKRRLYISATMVPELKELIFNMEELLNLNETAEGKRLGRPVYVKSFPCRLGILPTEVSVFELTGAEADYSYITPRVISSEADLSEDIAAALAADPASKALAFVASKDEGRTACARLNERGIKTVLLFHEDHSNPMTKEARDALETITNTGKFPEDVRVVLTTRILDNGVSIRDAAVTYLRVEGYDKISIIQEAGRIRPMEGQQITMTIPVPSESMLKRRLAYQKHMMTCLNWYYSVDERQRTRLLLDGEFDDVRGMIDPDRNEINPLLEYVNRYLHGSLSNRITDLEHGIYAERILDWFGLSLEPENDEVKKAQIALQRDLDDFLAGSVGRVMENQEWQNWKRDFQAKYYSVHRAPPGYRSDRTCNTKGIETLINTLGYSLRQETDKCTRKETYMIYNTGEM